ncbi:MAG: HEAT repeat domain-containing protein [Thermoguttaceae bacterium]|jgi:HEAT repeat protein
MKTKYMTLVLAACGCLTLGGSKLYADETPVAAIVAKDLKSEKEAEKVKALDELGARGEKAAEAVKPIEALLTDKSAKVRAHAALALGAIGSAAKDSAPALAELLKDADETVRRTALRAIRAIHPGSKMMVPICVKLLEDPDPAIHVRILNAIAECGAEAVPGLIEALKDDKAAFCALIVLRDIGPAAKDAIPAITEKLKDKKPEIRREAALTLGAFGEAAVPAVPQLAALVSDEHAGAAATFVLGELGQIPKDAEATVRTNTKSKDQMLSTTSLWALARVHPEDKELRREATEVLVARLKEQDPFVRVAAARALAALPPAPEITAPIWEKALKDADETTVRHAMDALAALGAPAVPRLIDALKYEKFRVDVVYALGRIGPAAAPATVELAKLIEDKNSRLAHEAIIALGNIGPGAKDAVRPLVKALEQHDNRDMNFASIAFALGKIGPEAASAESDLLKKLESKDDCVRLLSGWALAQIDPASALVAAKAVPPLIDGLALPELRDRLLCAEALGGFGPLAKSAAEALKKASTDENKDVQEAAVKALKAVEKVVAVPTAPTAPAIAAGGLPKPGDVVVTVEDRVEIGMRGSQQEIVPKGTKLQVLEIRGTWIGVRIDGKDKTGWVLGEQIGRP